MMVGAGFFDDLWGGIKKVAEIAGPRLLDFGLKKLGAGVKKSVKKGKGMGRGLTRTGGKVKRTVIPLDDDSDQFDAKPTKMGKGILDDELSTTLHLKRSGR